LKAFVIKKPGHAGLVEVPQPVPADDEVLIKVAAAGLCGTDIHIYKGEQPATYPLIPGHEFSGMVAAIGKKVKRFKPGDAVIADPNIFCENCYYCQQNKQMHCENLQAVGVTRNGAFAEYVTVPERCVFPAGDMDLVQGAMSEPLACVINAHNKVTIPVGGSVLIFGAGTIGLMHLIIAKRRGASRVVVVDLKPKQLELAKKLGANEVILSSDNILADLKKSCPRGFSVVIDATGVPSVVEMAITLLAFTGTFIAFGVCPQDSSIKINPFDLYAKELRLVGSYALEKTLPQSIAMLGE